MIEIRPGKDGVIPILPDIDFDNKIIVVVDERQESDTYYNTTYYLLGSDSKFLYRIANDKVTYPVVTLHTVDYPEDMENYQNLFRCLATKCTTARNTYTYFIVFDNYQEYSLWRNENIQN